MKPIRLTKHAQEQCIERGATEAEVRQAVEQGSREPAKMGRVVCRFNFPFGQTWQGSVYAIKQVAAVVKEESNEIVVITVYTFYF
ncbi:MAG: DUF4258 domain-containing protein [Deinococcus sp.]|nr:DUF4258 domain-containing protein [Deinococcus sp.]